MSESSFRPSRRQARASLGLPLINTDKENVEQTTHALRRKRAQSFGGESLKQASGENDGLSPRKKARRSLIPGRSILKAAPGLVNNAPGPLYTPNDTPGNTGTFNFTATINASQLGRLTDAAATTIDVDRRKSLARRVSFAPTAHLREFQRDNQDDDASNPSSPSSQDAAEAEAIEPVPSTTSGTHSRNSSITSLDDVLQQAADLSASQADDSAMSMETIDDTATTSAFKAAFAVPVEEVNSDNLLENEQEPSMLDDSAMDMVDPQAATTAFARSSILMPKTDAPVDLLGDSSSSDMEEDSVVAIALGAGAEYEVPIGEVSSPHQLDEDGESSMDVDMQATIHGPLVLTDGATSRRISLGGTIRRGSLAPGLAALAMLDRDEEVEETMALDSTEQHLPPIEEDEDDNTVEIEQPVAAEPQVKQRRLSLAPMIAQPVSKLVTPERPVSMGRGDKSPARSPMPRIGAAASSLARLSATELADVRSPAKSPRRPLPADDVFMDPISSAADAVPMNENMTLDEFLAVTKMDFFADMQPKKRKSLGHKTQDDEAKPRSRPTLADQIVAETCQVHDLDMYNTMSRELRASMSENASWMEDIEELLENDVPSVFQRYQEATAAEKAQMETRFKLAKSHFRLQVRDEWYQYRSNAIESVCEVFDQHQKAINQDREKIGAALKGTQDLLPQLHAQHDALSVELAKESERQRALAQVDQEHLSGLKDAIAEQKTQIENFSQEESDVEAQLARVRSKIKALQQQRQDATQSIANARAVCKQVGHVSKQKVQRNMNDLVVMQDLHAWLLVDYNESEFKLKHRNQLCVILRLEKEGLVDKVELSLMDSGEIKGRFVGQSEQQTQRIRAFLFERLRQQIESINQHALQTPAALLWHISSSWQCIEGLLQQIEHAALRYPFEAKLLAKTSRPEPFLRIALRLSIPDKGISLAIYLEMTGEEVLGQLQTPVDFGCTVESRADPVDCQELEYIMRDRISLGGKDAILEACLACAGKVVTY